MVAVTRIRLGRYSSPTSIGQPRPTISWSFDGPGNNFVQERYEITIERSGAGNVYLVESAECLGVAWPAAESDLASRERFTVSVRVFGFGAWTTQQVAAFETSLLGKEDWSAKFITIDEVQDSSSDKRPFHLVSSFDVDAANDLRVYATAYGVYAIDINGHRVGDDVLAPGWQSYKHRLHFQTYTIPRKHLVVGRNTIRVLVGEGWYAGHLTWDKGRRNIYGAEIGACVQVEADGKVVAATGQGEWRAVYGAILASELYNGEIHDFAAPEHETGTRILEAPAAIRPALISPEAPPIRAIDMLSVREVITTPSGKTILDFGQNLVGWVKVKAVPARSEGVEAITIRFAEVLEHGELGVRPLRDAKATDVVRLDDRAHADWEPTFTTHGFRYAEVSGVPVDAANFVAVVVHSDMERLGHFACSHDMLNQLHSNVVWGLRGNFVGLPTDCPQRDERLGWTGDIQVFTPTACFLYDTSALLANWMHDLHAEQLKDYGGVPNVVVPDVLQMWGPPHPQAVWADVTSLTPEALYQAYGNCTILSESWESMCAWLDKGVPTDGSGLWEQLPGGVQLGDWLDPNAPPNDPGDGRTDPYLVADAYLVRCTLVVSQLAAILAKPSDQMRFGTRHGQLREAFRRRYVTPLGLLSSDSQTAYCLALHFGLLDGDEVRTAVDRLVHLVIKNEFKIGTGFAGTPLILDVLAAHGKLAVAYRMLQEKQCPSWLYPISLGATTIWERWDSMLPDGSINPGEMTSFNHYALGSVANFLHGTIGGISPIEPGWKRFRIQPRPGGTITSARVSHRTPYGLVECDWKIVDGEMTVNVVIPANTRAEVVLGDKSFVSGSGRYTWRTRVESDPAWPPKLYKMPFGPPKPDEYAP